MLAELTLASQRAQCLVVGEDLGTVPHGLGEALDAADVLSYRVLWFERGPPQEWTRKAAACVSTHDLPTLAGWWAGADIAERTALGLAAPGAEVEREAERQALLAALGHPAGITTDQPFSDGLAAAIHAHVSAGAPLLMLAQSEDFSGETMAVNLPGTDRERPNWRRRLSTPLPGLCATPRGRAILDALTGRR
jgi:glycogen operon protein